MLKNRWLALAIAGELCLLVLVVYTPALQIFFEVVSLSSAQWLLVVCAAATIVPVVECAKHLRFFHREKAMQ
jgi:Ca2+-transporting ATPase